MTGTKVKGLFKGLRYISQIFDEEAEDEIKIGFPTDVKHVAHIGMDGPSASTPSWMNEFKGPSDVSRTASAPASVAAPLDSVETPEDSKNSKNSKPHKIPKSRHASLENNNTDSPARPASKQGRRQRLSDPSSDSTARDPPSDGTRQSRRHRKSNPESDSPAAEGTPAAPKPGRRRKPKAASGDDSVKSGRSSRRSSKGDSMTDISLPDLDSLAENGHESKPTSPAKNED